MTLTLISLMGSAMLSGCASARELALPTVVPSSDAGSASLSGTGFAGVQLRMRREDAVAALGAQSAFSADPVCTMARLAPADGSRRAFPVERCVHQDRAPDETASTRLAGHRVHALVSYYIDGRLVRIDAELDSDDSQSSPSFEQLSRQLSERYERVTSGPAERDVDTEEAARIRERWKVGNDLIDLNGAHTRHRLTVIDGAVLAVIPAMDADDPAEAQE